jgi:hypothetical protein
MLLLRGAVDAIPGPAHDPFVELAVGVGLRADPIR